VNLLIWIPASAGMTKGAGMTNGNVGARCIVPTGEIRW